MRTYARDPSHPFRNPKIPNENYLNEYDCRYAIFKLAMLCLVMPYFHP